MSEVDPATIARFIESRATAVEPGRFALAAPQPLHQTSSTRPELWAQQRLRQSSTVMGAMFRGLEGQVGAAQALEVVAEIHLASKAAA